MQGNGKGEHVSGGRPMRPMRRNVEELRPWIQDWLEECHHRFKSTSHPYELWAA
jgi:hypothetical protein